MPEFWNEMMEIPEARWIVYGTLLVFAILVAVYVSVFFRNLAIGQNENESSDLLSEFRNLRDQGHLDEKEYDRLKTVIPENVKPEILRGVGVGDEPHSNDEGVEKKTFMTLAEAESRKKSSQNPVDDKMEQKD